ncbi:beta-lactamase [Colletotrichum graminicola]|uniref:Beta-lactamase n=1 Tax=Colletotrichum graminicola (strain M1.001 / M2 / FGSC 10212) TaxID=645133 RepID=E3QKN4_COLGM|nr:beta-lactamase [Colletotrichum graminicola M1.001]EFQ31422.1 beta-lactamase [Colletotrichum graminicola M1.001]WDK19705.1 beta-lactamase [Colletotrichum graminicola]
MLRTFVLSLLASAAVAAAAAANVPTEEVPLLGPSFLSNFDPTDSQHIWNATESFPRVIEALFESGQLNKTDLVFAVDVFTAATNKSLYSYYHVGEDGKAGLTSGELNDGTIGRIGSAGVEVLDHPVMKYIPELLGNSSDNSFGRIRWDGITVGALASHQAGSGGVDRLASPDMTLEELQTVSPEDLFDYMSRKRPVISPYRTAVYSDGGYSLLGQVLARLTGQTYANALQSIILEPLGLDGTTAAAPNSTNTNSINRALYTESSLFGVDFPVTASSGGIYSNTADLRALGLSILNLELLSGTNTSRWMKPLSGTGSFVELAGAPWEIARLAIPTSAGSNRTRISDLYTKAGGNSDYTCIFALSLDHGIEYSILVAGSTATPARWPIRYAVGELFIPAAEAAAADNARLNLAGTFVAASAGSNMTLGVDAEGAGLGVESASIDGEDGTAGASALRLFPTSLYSNSRSLSALYGSRGTFSTAFRMVTYPVKLKPRSRSEGGAGGLFDNSHVWMGFDAQEAVDEYVFTIEDGRLVNITSSYTQMTFMRSD